MEFKLENITPAKAAEYLRHNTNNYRKLSRAKYKQYAEDMKAGKWQTNGEPIVFGEDGILKDGQHRLAAIIESKKTVQMAVIRGVDKTVDVYDVGMSRTAVQIARNRDIDVNQTIVAAANIILGRFNRSVTKSQTIDYVADNLDEFSRAYRCTVYGARTYSKKAACVAASYLMLRSKALMCYEVELFFRLFDHSEGANAEGYDVTAPFMARAQFESREGSNGSAIRKEQLEIITRALLDFHEGKHVEIGYKIQEPFVFDKYLNAIRKSDKF